ncbi:MAG: alginate lyase family protein [Chloroflexi bacterium]|nr:alginate lyase family protein [Chloroflexota bacterium]
MYRTAGSFSRNGDPGLEDIAHAATYQNVHKKLPARPCPRFFAVPEILHSPTRSQASLLPWRKDILQAAERAARHVFQYAGFPHVTLQPEIDWLGNPYAATVASSGAGALPDSRVIWELNRCHQLPLLGLAYQVTADESFAGEILEQMRSWAKSNPPWEGANWDNAMEAAVRITNWVWAYHLCRSSPHFSETKLKGFLYQVQVHGAFIVSHLERGPVSNNHYLADGVGLLHLGMLFPEIKGSRNWLQKGKDIVFKEVIQQSYPDGVSYEGSVPYHGFVLELLLPTLALCRINNINVPKNTLQRIERMLEFVMAYSRLDGSYPQFGDRDDGRFLPFAIETPDSHARLLAVGAVLFDRPDFKEAAPGWTLEAQLCLGDQGHKEFDELPPTSVTRLRSRAFQRGGVYVMRHGDLHMTIDCADVGLKGRGGHGHNDCLSFELYAHGRTLLADSGTYQYDAPMSERNLFRCTAAHNTAGVDGQEMADLSQEDPWRIASDAHPTVHQWHSDADYDIFEGSHNGYTRFKHPVRHRRCVVFGKKDRAFLLVDAFLGEGVHTYEAFFHLTPEHSGHVEVTENPPGFYTVDPTGANIAVLCMDKEAHLKLSEGYVSRRYGEKAAAPVARFSWKGPAPAALRFCLCPIAPGGTCDLKKLLLTAASLLELPEVDRLNTLARR